MSIINAWQGKRILVLGDLMVDQYLWGDSSRISPEAPVPVVDVEKREVRPGGAANAALNVKALGGEVILAGVIGADKQGKSLKKLMGEADFDTSCLIQSPSRQTTVKTRVMSRGQQLLRIDEEDTFPLGKDEYEALEKGLTAIGNFDAMLISDYDKGMLNGCIIRRLIRFAKEKKAHITVDPKYNNFFDYEGASLFKPNLRELNEAYGLQLSGTQHEEIRQAVTRLRQEMPHEQSLITLGKHGMLAIDAYGEAQHRRARLRQVVDVSGAGDTTIAVATLALAAGSSLVEATRLANTAAGLACDLAGVVPVTREMLANTETL
jgi:rfaE bifunctional protein kinase chain/domain